MLQSIFIHAFIFSSFVAYGQVRFNNLSSTGKDENVLYIGVDNYIEVSGLHDNTSKPSFKSTHGEITKAEDKKYLIRVNSTEPDTLKVYQNDSLRLTEVFSVKVIPHPVAQLGTSNDTVLSVAQIKLNPFLSVVLPGCAYKDNLEIISFSATIIDAIGDTTFSDEINGNRLSKTLLFAIAELHRNDKILFDDIIATCPDCRNPKLPNLLVTIK
jgi:hypothetical protein